MVGSYVQQSTINAPTHWYTFSQGEPQSSAPILVVGKKQEKIDEYVHSSCIAINTTSFTSQGKIVFFCYVMFLLTFSLGKSSERCRYEPSDKDACVMQGMQDTDLGSSHTDDLTRKKAIFNELYTTSTILLYATKRILSNFVSLFLRKDRLYSILDILFNLKTTLRKANTTLRARY